MRRKKQKDRLHYLDEFLRCRCAGDMAEMELFPNAKEITESFGAYEAVRVHLFRHFQFADNRVVLISVGDGSTPRTAATFAYRSTWQCHSVDPLLKKDKTRWNGIERLVVHRKAIQDCQPSDFGITPSSIVVIAAVHSHAPLDLTLNAIGDVQRLGVVAIPCCVPLTLPIPTSEVYQDASIASPHNTVVIWEVER